MNIFIKVYFQSNESLPEELPIGPGPDTVHGAGLQVHKDGSGDVLPTTGLVVVHIDPLELEVGLPLVGPGGVDAMLVADDLPELGADLVAALASLDMHDFSHLESGFEVWSGIKLT